MESVDEKEEESWSDGRRETEGEEDVEEKNV